MGTVEHLARCVEADLSALFPEMYKNPREKLAVMIACLIETRSCNTTELAARLPPGLAQCQAGLAKIEFEVQRPRAAWPMLPR